MFEKKESDANSKITRLKKNDIAIDCGANVGNITEIMAKNGAEVFAFEPNPFAFRVLEKRFDSNKNIHLFNKGVWDRNTSVKLYFHENSNQDEIIWSTGSSILDFKKNINKDKYVIIEVIDLVEFIKKLGRNISVLKIDIEGAECEVVEKIIISGIYKKIRYIFVETHENKIPELREKIQKIKELIKAKRIRNINLSWI